jgi:2,3-bisphosphoglycerate-dependent phosphoglycerate mutase
MKLYFVRHGESEANLLHEFSNRGLKHGLTETGRQQAEVLARILSEASIVRLFSSPLLRAVQTAEILARELNLSIEISDALREYDCGILEGRSDAGSWEIFTTVFEDWTQRRQWEACIEQGESFLDIQRRFVPFIERLIQEHGDSAGGIVLVGHGGTYRCMLPLVLANIDPSFAAEQPIPHTAAIVAELRSEGLVCLRWGETSVPDQG